MIIEQKELVKKIEFEERIDNPITKDSELYFILPKEYLKILLNITYSNAYSSYLCLTINKEHPNIKYVKCKYSPTEKNNEYDCYFDWNYVKLENKDIMFLIDLYKLMKKYKCN